jgi:1,4-alpha-glucan branching enzyme
MKKTAQVKSSKRRVSFSLEAPHAKQVFLAGDFNTWDPKKHPMKKNADGLWEKTVILAPGTYEYKFIQDGQWIVDPGNDRQCPNRFGTRNCVVVVSS